MTLSGPIQRAALVALAMTAFLAAILVQRALHMASGVDVTLVSVPDDRNSSFSVDARASIASRLYNISVPIHPDSPALASLRSDRYIDRAWVSLKPGPDGRQAVMRVSSSRLGPQTGEIILQTQSLWVPEQSASAPHVDITLPTVMQVTPDTRAQERYLAGKSFDVVFSVSPGGRALLRRVQQGDVVLLEAPGLL